MQRQTHIDALKCIGSQLIVLHHFSAYGPLADALHRQAPALAGWFYDYARMAVQVFLVLGGYLAVQSLRTAAGLDARAWVQLVVRRYLRLALPLMAALLLAIAAATLSGHWLQADFLPAAPTPAQLLAHALLLQGVLGLESLSAGIWYVAIDFQLYALLALLLWWGARAGRAAQAAVLVLMLASLWHFNRDAGWDNWALYFFGSYGLGVAAFWATGAERPSRWLVLLGLAVALALLIEWRTRIALAALTALALAAFQLRAVPLRWPPPVAGLLAGLGRSSYALFLVHFPVLMLANVAYAQWGGPQAAAVWLTLLLGWGASMALARTFERRVEAPLQRWISSIRRA